MKDKFSVIIIALSILVGSILISLSIHFTLVKSIRDAATTLLYGLIEMF